MKFKPFMPLLVGAMLLQLPTEASAAKQVPERSEIPAQYKWHLDDIYTTEEAWENDSRQLQQELKNIARYQGHLGESGATLLACLQARDEISITSGKLYAFARMHRDEDSANAAYQAMTSKIEALLAEAGAATAFIEPEILALPPETLTQFRQTQPKLAVYDFYFKNLARQKQHVLTPAEEAILSHASEIGQSPETIFNMLAHADMKFPETLGLDGQALQLSEGRYGALIRSQDRDVRQQAFEHLHGTYHQYRNTFAATLSGNVKKNIFFAKTRKYDSVLSSALETDNVPAAVYDNLITTVHQHLQPLHRYVALKKKVLQLDDIHMYDLYVPLTADASLHIPYAEGTQLVKQGLQPLGPAYGQALQHGLTSGWIDVYENRGKQTGAYSWGTYGSHPFVLLNYNDRYDDASTLAHEMGHALHSFYSQQAQPYPTSSYTTFCAEVASTTNEILLLDHMLKTTTDKKAKAYLLNQYLEQVRTTIYRQTLFAEFERTIYQKAEHGEPLTADMLDALWHELNVKYYGPDIVVDSAVDSEWARIPHFYWSFYVYQYVTGYAAATTLADQVQHQGAPAQERYLNFLRSGGSDYSLELLKKAGVDMSSPQPLEITLQKFNRLLDELEALLAE